MNNSYDLNSILNAIAIQKLSIELDVIRKQKDELQDKLNNINKISIIENGKTNLADDQIKIK